MKATRITLDVAHPDDIQPDEVATAINHLLNVGLSDAQDTVAGDSLDNSDARLAVSLVIGQPTAAALS
jgi:hypothetical protein